MLLVDNTWVEAGLMNGALGTLKGYMWPEGGDPNSSDPRLRTPLCLIVEFDDVNLKDENGVPRTFFPNEPDKARWVPVFKKDVHSSNDAGVYRSQFPLVLAWALTHWKAQGMTLRAARVYLSEKTVAMPGLAFVACTRVRHPWDLVFENDLPEYEHFMKAKGTKAFRRRKRWELRLQQRASHTLRKYGFCDEDEWRKDEALAAASLLTALGRVAEKQRETLRDGPGRAVDEDTWLWSDREPCYEELLRSARDELLLTENREDKLAEEREARRKFLEDVSERLLDRRRRRVLSAQDRVVATELLTAAEETGREVDCAELVRSVVGEDEERFEQYVDVARVVRRRLGQVGEWDCRIEESLPGDIDELHMPAVKGALGALIPASLHERFDNAAAKQRLPKDLPRGGSYLKFDGWRVSVYEEESLARGRLDLGMLEFFLKVLEQCSSQMRLRVSVGSRTLGKLVGTSTSLDGFCRVVSRWRECWNPDEVKRRDVLLLPVPTVDVPAPRDWVFVAVRARDGHSSLGQAEQLEVKVYDRMVRKMLNDRIARFVQALFRDGAVSLDPEVVPEDFPECRVATQRSACVLGLIAAYVQEVAGQTFLDRGSPTFVPDFLLVLRAVFAKLRTEAAAKALTDMKDYVVGEECRKLLSMFGEVPCLRSTLTTQQSAGVVRDVKDAEAVILKAATWNISGGQKSAQAPESWLLADQANEVVKEVLRWDADVVALQEVLSDEPIERLLHRYNHVGSSGSHRGFVHLYVSKNLTIVDCKCDRPGVVLCRLRLKSVRDDVESIMMIVAVHLPSGIEQAVVKTRSSVFAEVSRASEDTGVLILGDMNCKDEEAADVCKKNFFREACYAGSSWGTRSNKFHACVEYEGSGLRYDRMFTSGSVWAATFVAGNRKTFFEGFEFFLSDHHPVIGFFECHQVFQESGRASVSMAGARRARIVALRDLRLREEQVDSFELLRQGREEKAFVRHAAEEESRVAAWHAQRKASLERGRKARERWESAFGTRSVWGCDVEENKLLHLATVSLAGWEEDSWNVEVPTAAFLRGITSGQTDVVMPCLLQVVLRLPQMQAWIEMHSEHCKNASACALCWLTKVQSALGSQRGRKCVQVGYLPEGVVPQDVQDMKWVLESFLEVLSKSEVASGRVGEVHVPASSSAVVTHVDRLFGWFCQTRERCQACGLNTERTELSDSRIFVLPVKELDGGVCTVTDLYLEHCMPVESTESKICHNCKGCTRHAVASRLSTTPDVLVLWLERDLAAPRVSIDMEEDLMLPGLAPVRLVSVIYRARRPDGTASYSCSCRGPMDSWWYFEEGRAPEPIKRSISHVKQKHSCMLVYERVVKRGKAVKRRGAGGSGQGSRHQKRLRTNVPSTDIQIPGAAVPPKSWPARALKRYPSWVDPLEFERLRQARFENKACDHAEVYYRELGSECGALALAEAVAHEFEDHITSTEDVVFVFACILNALDCLKRSSTERAFADLCGDAASALVEESLNMVRQCDDPAVSLQVLSRVTGIVDLETPVVSAGTASSVESRSFGYRCNRDHPFTLDRQEGSAAASDAAAAAAAAAETDKPSAEQSRTLSQENVVSSPRVESTDVAVVDEGGACAGNAEVAGETDTLVTGTLGSLRGVDDAVVLDADEHGGSVGVSDKADESAVVDLDASAGADVANEKPKPRRRLKRAQSGDAEAKPVRRSARIAGRGGHVDSASLSSRRRA